MSQVTLLGISGALRAASTNRLLLREAARRFGNANLVEADILFPLFDQDIQDGPGVPSKVMAFAEQIEHADAVLISTPEYNKGISGALKNALDWLSRTGKKPLLNKPLALMSAAAGRSGGERSMTMTRECLMAFRPHLVAGPEVSIAQTAAQWDDNGVLTNDRSGQAIDDLMAELRAVIEMRA